MAPEKAVRASGPEFQRLPARVGVEAQEPADVCRGEHSRLLRAVQAADEPAGHHAQEPRQCAVVGRVEGKLSHADVPGEISGFRDPGQVVERLDRGMVECVFLGRVEAALRQAGESFPRRPPRRICTCCSARN
jgi:hypothetical protein